MRGWIAHLAPTPPTYYTSDAVREAVVGVIGHEGSRTGATVKNCRRVVWLRLRGDLVGECLVPLVKR